MNNFDDYMSECCSAGYFYEDFFEEDEVEEIEKEEDGKWFRVGIGMCSDCKDHCGIIAFKKDERNDLV